MTPRSAAHRRTDCRGFGLIELMAMIAVVSILAAMGLTSFDQRRQDINTSLRQVSSDLRWARSRAIVAGEHFRFNRTGDGTYDIERLESVDGSWQVGAVVRQISLPDHISLDTGSSNQFEIDGRGTIVFADPSETAPVTWTLSDAHFATTRVLTLYPSGQIHVDE